MQHMEYRFEEIALTDEGTHGDQIVARLNELARDGWRVSGIYLADHPSWSTRMVPVLLEREAAGVRPATPELAGAVRG